MMAETFSRCHMFAAVSGAVLFDMNWLQQVPTRRLGTCWYLLVTRRYLLGIKKYLLGTLTSNLRSDLRGGGGGRGLRKIWA